MKRALGVASVLLIALSCAAFQLTIPLGGSGSSDSSPGRKSTRSTSRTLSGSVLNKSDQPVPNAVVYLKDTKTLAIRTFIAQNDGTYRFPGLSNNVDYEVYAEQNGNKSSTKVLSHFDDRDQPRINLKIDTNKDQPATK